jgi:FKBP-type peptidyl-prolyl cis-trans isomerase FkpA
MREASSKEREMTRAGWGAAAVIGILAVVAACRSGAAGGAAAPDLKSEDDKTLYALGVSMGGNLAGFGLSAPEMEIVKRGFADGASGGKPAVEMQTYGPKIRTMMQERVAQKAQGEKDRSQGFLTQAAGEKGATKTASGLVYTELQKGAGPSPKPTDTVKVNYRGTLTNGTEFDSSYKRGQPAEFPLNGVIPCFGEGLQKMAVGGKAKLVCPSSLAYGDAGSPPVIPPGATLVFEVELLGIGAGK